MGLNEGQALAYGHVKEAEGIEGLELLEEHFAAMRKEANGGVSDGSDVEFPEGDDEGGWDDWDRESDASDESSGWENVSDDGDDLEISDSDDEAPRKAKKAKIDKTIEEEVKEDEDEDVDMDDDTKSVVSAAPSAATEVTKKLSLLAQQKVSLTQAD